MTGCAGSSTSGSSSSSGSGGSASSAPIKIAYSVDVLDDTQNAFLAAMKARITELKSQGVTVDLQTYDAQSSVDKQLSDIQTALVKQPKVLIVSGVDPKGVLPAVAKAKAAGVKTIDKRPSDPEPSDYDVAFYSNDETRYTAATKKWLTDYLAANPSVNI
jgi:ABC-type sugar transport system substrate-binding protein